MSALIEGFNPEGVVTINRVILKPEYSTDDLEMRVAELWRTSRPTTQKAVSSAASSS